MIHSKEALASSPIAVTYASQTVGVLRLARYLLDRLSEAGTPHGACEFLAELLPPLLDADGVSIEVPASVSLKPYKGPTAYFERSSRSSLEVFPLLCVPLMVQREAVGRISLYYEHESAETKSHGLAVLEFVGSCLSLLIGGSLIATARLATLTHAERRVLALFMQPTREILDILCISLETLRTHKKHIYRKLGVRSQQEALEMARRAGLFGEVGKT